MEHNLPTTLLEFKSIFKDIEPTLEVDPNIPYEDKFKIWISGYRVASQNYRLLVENVFKRDTQLEQYIKDLHDAAQ